MLRLTPLAAALALFAAPAFADAPDGWKSRSVAMEPEAAVDAFLAVLGQKGATVFKVVEHHDGAKDAGMELPVNTVVIFGNPKLGTPMMKAAPAMGAELPMKAHFTGDGDGGTTVTYTDIMAVAERHGVPTDHEAVQKAAKALDGLTGAIAK